MLVNVFNYNSYRSFYIALGRGEINSNLIMETFLPRLNKNSANIQKVKNRLPIIGLTKGQAVNFAECCNPLPGENIVGILTEKKGINVHLINCSVLERFTDFPELWYELTWNTKSGKYLQTARISLTVQNKIGSLNKITSCISELNANIVDIKINKREEDFFYMEVDVQVADYKHFNDLFVSLKLEDAIYKIERI
jgi:(p)ppGpp synthase/HD superfamily hydrolase